MKRFPVNCFFDTSINRESLKIISYQLIKHFQIIKYEVSRMKDVNNMNKAARMHTKQQQKNIQNECALS